MKELDRLVEIMKTLRSERGCPWDKKQTHQTLKPYLIEETYEVIDAIDKNQSKELKEELGDLLFQIIFHCQLASERGDFDLKEVCVAIAEKMTKRHPHVFGDSVFESAEEFARQWEQRKQEEGKNKTSLFEGIPNHMPALLKAQRVQSRASKVGFDWGTPEEAFQKLPEEIKELAFSLSSNDTTQIEEEIGDLLFSVVNVARLCKVNPEEALKKTVNKFIKRFDYITKKAEEMGIPPSDMTLQEMDALWDEAKRELHKSSKKDP